MAESQPSDNSREQKGISANDSSQANIHNQTNYHKSAPPALAPAPRDRAEVTLLEAVRSEVALRQESALHNRVHTKPNTQTDPSPVDRLGEIAVKVGSAAPERCPSGISVMEIFDCPAIAGRLLVLGAPGSGKTTTLLQLAKVLVARSLADGDAPVPVLLNLLSWKPQFRDIRSWMVAELTLKYRVKQENAAEWIERRRILPLLDGLGELTSERQETCVLALNDFLRSWRGSPLVVCSQSEKHGIHETTLELNGSVTLLPLSDGQIERYLREAKCDWLWDVVKSDAKAIDLLRAPLMLTILVLASEGLQGQELERWLAEENAEERRRLLFAAYADQRLKRRYVGGLNLPARKGSQKPYRDEAKIRRWLGWLARRSREADRAEIFLEALQPSFLVTRWQKFVYRLVFRLGRGLALGVLLGLVLGLVFGIFFGLFLGLVAGMAIGLLVGLAFGLLLGLEKENEYIETAATAEVYWRDLPRVFYQKLRKSLTFGLTGGAIGGLLLGTLGSMGGLISTIEKSTAEQAIGLAAGALLGLGVGSVIGLLLGLFVGLIFRLLVEPVRVFRKTEITVRTQDDRGIFAPTIDALRFGGRALLVGLLTLLLLSYVIPAFVVDIFEILALAALAVALPFFLAALVSDLGRAIEHFALRFTLWLFGCTPWNYRRFLDDCTELGFLQRIGSGYQFVHARLRDRLADTEPRP